MWLRIRQDVNQGVEGVVVDRIRVCELVPAESVVIPEPLTMLGLAAGAGAVAGYLRRRRVGAKGLLVLVAAGALALAAAPAGAATLFSDGFEGDTAGDPPSQWTLDSGRYTILVDSVDPMTGANSLYWDTGGGGDRDPGSITASFDITGYQGVVIGAHTESTYSGGRDRHNTWEDDDTLVVEYGFGAALPATWLTAYSVSDDHDTPFTHNVDNGDLPGGTTTMWLRMTIDTNSGAEDFNMDDVLVTGEPIPQVIPEPLTMLGLLAGAGAVAGYVRRRRG
jgi:hypothetical protein